MITLAEFFHPGKTGYVWIFNRARRGLGMYYFQHFQIRNLLQLYRGRNNTDPQLVYSEFNNNNNNKSTKAETVKAAPKQKSWRSGSVTPSRCADVFGTVIIMLSPFSFVLFFFLRRGGRRFFIFFLNVHSDRYLKSGLGVAGLAH